VDWRRGRAALVQAEIASGEPGEASTLFGLLLRAASRFGSKPALQVCRSGQWSRLSYRQLLAGAQTWGRVLAAAGLSPGDRALVISESSPEWGIGYFAILSQGAVAVPLDPHLGGADVAAIAARVNARVWLVSRAVLSRIGAVATGAVESPTIFEIDGFSALPEQAALTPEGHPAAPPRCAYGEGGRREPPEPADMQAWDLTASILFTSGTTLAPKGVPLTHRNFLSNVLPLVSVMHFGSRDELISVLPMHHALEFTGGFLSPLSRGATITYVERVTPRALLEAMQATRSTVMIGVPRLCVLLVKAIQAGAGSLGPWGRISFAASAALARFSQALASVMPPLSPQLRALRASLFRPVHRRLGGHVRLIVSGGAALPPEVFDALDLMGFTVCEGYGLTETAPVLTVNPPERPRRGTVGRPLPGVKITIEEPSAEGIGAVLAQGPSVFRGYLEDEQATRGAFCGEWFRTGDLGRFDRCGYLVLAGRADDVIVTGGGKNVYPMEVEWLYQSLPHVKEFCVVGMSDPASAGDAVHAVVVEDDAEGSPPTEARRAAIESAVSEISRRVSPHQRIRRVHYWEGDLPRTPTLKVRRKQVQAVLREVAARSRPHGT